MGIEAKQERWKLGEFLLDPIEFVECETNDSNFIHSIETRHRNSPILTALSMSACGVSDLAIMDMMVSCD